MALRNIDAPTADDLSYICSRQHEDYLDWLENQKRPSYDLFKPIRRLAGAMVGLGTLIAAAFLSH